MGEMLKLNLNDTFIAAYDDLEKQVERLREDLELARAGATGGRADPEALRLVTEERDALAEQLRQAEALRAEERARFIAEANVLRGRIGELLRQVEELRDRSDGDANPDASRLLAALAKCEERLRINSEDLEKCRNRSKILGDQLHQYERGIGR